MSKNVTERIQKEILEGYNIPGRIPEWIKKKKPLEEFHENFIKDIREALISEFRKDSHKKSRKIGKMLEQTLAENHES